MLAFLSLFLKFYLADTPHRRNAQHFGGWLWTVTIFSGIGILICFHFTSDFLFYHSPRVLPTDFSAPASCIFICFCTFWLILCYFVTVQSQAKFHKTGGKCLHFNRINCEAVIRLWASSESGLRISAWFLFLKFYLADTPHRRNA